MRKITSFLLSMILALVAIPIQAAIQADVIIDQEFSSLTELEGKAFAIVNKETGKALFGSTMQVLGYDILANAFMSSNSGYYFKLDTPKADAEDETITDFYLLRLQTPAGEPYSFAWGEGYLNSQPATKDCSFILGLNNQNGQDIKNGAVWDIQYVEGKGFTLFNKGTGFYLNDNAPAKYEEPVYWTFCTLKKDWMTAFKPLFDEEAVIKACGTSEEANAAYDAIVDPIKANVETGNITDPEADLATIDAALNDLVKAQTTAGADFTRLIANPEINGADGWTIERPLGGNGPLLGGTSFEYWAGSSSDRAQASFDYYQIISGLTNGAYCVTADLYNSLNGEEGATWNATSGVYGKGINESVALVDEDGVTLKPYTTGQVFVVDGTIRFGVKNTVTPMAARWFVADNFKLTYLGSTPEYEEATKPYTISIAEEIVNGTISADVETAIAGATVTLTATPAEGYKLESISVMAGDTPVEVSEEGTFVMPAAAVIISAVFAAEAVEPEPTPVAETFTATLVHTASSTRGNTADIVNTVDADKEHVNNTNFNNVWAASAYAEFSLADLPNGATITKATLSYTGISTNNRDRNTDVLYVNAGETIDYESMPTSGTAVGLGATLIETVTFPANATTPFTADVTDALKAILASQNYIIIKWTNNVGGGDIAGKASENAPQLVVEYMPGAPEIANASFEADGEKAASGGPLTMTGWTFDGVGTQFNNTELRPAGSTSTSSAFGTSDPSDGEYSLFFRQGWNGTGNTITITSDALAAIPSGDYTLSVDYKQQYAYDNTQNSNTKVGIALVYGEETIGSEISPAAEAGGSATYFNETEWSTLTASFTIDKTIAAGSKVVITLYSAGQKRSDFFLDNVKLVKVPGVELALIDLNKAIETAKAEAGKYIVGDGLFQYPASQIEPLTSAIAAAESAYEAAESKETVVAATDALNAALASFAPVATLPAADKQYTLSLKTSDEASPFQLSIAETGITIAEVGTAVSFVAQEDGTYALSNGTEYVVYSGANTWTLAASADPYGWTIAAVEGGYTITGKNGFLGTNTKDGSAAGSTCYGDKKSSNGFYIWTISEYVAPAPTYAIAIAEGIENGTIAANVETAEEGATVTLTATPAEGYKLEAITVTADGASVDVTEAEGAYTFAMPAAAVTVSATFVAEAVEPTPDPNLIEIAQTVDADENLACEKIEGEEYTQYNFGGDISVAFKMLNVDVKDCDYVVIKFAEPTPAGLSASFVEGQGNESIPEGVTEWKNIIAENTTVKDGIIPQITLLTIFTGAGKSVKVEGVYKHKVAAEPIEPELATVENMTLTVAEDAVMDDKDKTFPVVFGYKAIVDESISPMASMSVTYKVTTNGEEILSETFAGIDIAKETQNIWIKNMEYGKTYTVTITSVSVSYFDLETLGDNVVYTKTFAEDELTATFTTNAVPVSIDGINAAAKSNRKVVENGRVVIYKNGVKTMSSGVSIR